MAVLMLCSALLGCQPVADGSAILNPTTAPTEPIPVPTDPATVPTTPPTDPATVPTEPMPTEPQPTDPPIKQTVTPVNTYVFRHYYPNDSTRFYYDNFKYIPPDINYYFDDVPLGEVMFSPQIQAFIEENDDTTVGYVYVYWGPTLYVQGLAGCLPTEDVLALRADLINRFEEAGYDVYHTLTRPMPTMTFAVWISVGQLKELDCGDDVACYIFRCSDQTY